MRKFWTLTAIVLLSVFWFCQTSIADTIYLKNGHEIYGKASAHPVFSKTHTLVSFSNSGNMTLKNSEIERIVPNNKDQFDLYRDGEAPEG